MTNQPTPFKIGDKVRVTASGGASSALYNGSVGTVDSLPGYGYHSFGVRLEALFFRGEAQPEVHARGTRLMMYREHLTAAE